MAANADGPGGGVSPTAGPVGRGRRGACAPRGPTRGQLPTRTQMPFDSSRLAGL